MEHEHLTAPPPLYASGEQSRGFDCDACGVTMEARFRRCQRFAPSICATGMNGGGRRPGLLRPALLDHDSPGWRT